jgi:hypothetical protein
LRHGEKHTFWAEKLDITSPIAKCRVQLIVEIEATTLEHDADLASHNTEDVELFADLHPSGHCERKSDDLLVDRPSVEVDSDCDFELVRTDLFPRHFNLSQ